MNTKPRALILSGYGLNCEEETAFAFERAGVETSIKHLSDLIEQPDILKRFQILAVPGGFSFGDHTGSGRAYGNKLKANLKEALQ
ncbi:MAG: Phosphoribosylformylglycinamidine synthase 1, partial [Parcubacteria group bacterium GW2011_GWA2_56_21]